MGYRDRGYSRPREPREMHKVTCADCGVETEVPFKPDGVRPVYCRDCYQKRRPRRNRY
ncbi:MAG: CxxC-x17-CxxC domain-containing protein [Candidatus Hermodarchaeota archaeon]